MNHATHSGFGSPSQQRVLREFQEYLERDGKSLDALIRQARADTNVHETQALRSFARGVTSRYGPQKLVIRIGACANELLCALGEAIVAVEGAYTAPDIDAAICWHLGRLTDFERDIRRAFHV